MSLNTNFLNQLSRGTLKTNVVVVFSPKNNFYSSVNTQTPFGNPNFDGSQSYILWKREPDSTRVNDNLDLSKHFAEFLDGNLPGGDITLECIDSVSIAGGEIDVKSAEVQDDGVDISVVLQNVVHKSFFQNLIGYNVEVFFGFSDAGFNFFDYERFYVGKLNGLASNSNLTLTLKVGTLADFWNKTWVHSQKLARTKLAYKYPLETKDNEAGIWNDVRFKGRNIYKRTIVRPVDQGGNIDVLDKFSFESDIHRAIKPVFLDNDEKYLDEYAFDYEYNYPRWRTRQNSVFLDVPLPGDSEVNRYLKPTSAIFFSPSGKLENIEKEDAQAVGLNRLYPLVDQDFLNARLAPTANNKIRFKLDDTIVESNYIDMFVFWPLVLVNTDGIGGNPLSTPTSGTQRIFVFDVERMPNNPEAAQSADIAALNSITPLSQRPVEYTLDDTVLNGRPFPNTLDKYTNLYRLSWNYGNINRLKFATKLKFFIRAAEDLDFEAGTDIVFYDVRTGIGTLSEILIATLTQNLSLSSSVIDQQSFNVAKERQEVLMQLPQDPERTNLRGDPEYLNFDYSMTEDDEASEIIQERILKSNNLRIYLERGVLKCLFMQSESKPILQEQVGDDFVPFLISEDDILESTVYEARPEEQIKRLKIKTAFRNPEDTDGQLVFYAVDRRSQDRSTGNVVLSRQPDAGFTDDDFEEVSLHSSFVKDTKLVDSRAGHTGKIGDLFALLPFELVARHAVTFATFYFNAVNPFIKLTITTGARGFLVSVGDVIVVRDHQAFELFGSQFIKAFVINKSVNDWGTDNVSVTLEVFYVGKSLDFLQARRPTPPRKFREVNKTAGSDRAYTQVSLTFDAPNDWGHAQNDDLLTYKLYEVTTTGSVLRDTLRFNLSKDNSFASWSSSNRSLVMQLNNDRTYRFFVTADNGVFESVASNIVEVDTLPSVVAPSAPRNLAIGSFDRQDVDLSWQAPTSFGGDDIVTYNFYVNDELITNVGRDLTFVYNFISNPPGEVISMHVTAVNFAGESGPSNVVQFTVPQPLPVPEGTIDISATPVSTSQVDITWSATITRGNEGVDYDLYRSTLLGDGGRVVQEGITEATVRDDNLLEDTTYFYKVVARNASGDGVESRQVQVKTLASVVRSRPRAPTGFRFG